MNNKGVIFSGTDAGAPLGTSGLIGTNGAFGTFYFGNSEPNFVILGVGSLTATFVEPFTVTPATVSNVTLRVGDGDPGPEAIGVNAFDRDGEVIFSQVVHLLEKGTTISIRSKGIAEIRVFGISVVPFTGFAIDDFAYKRKND